MTTTGPTRLPRGTVPHIGELAGSGFCAAETQVVTWSDARPTGWSRDLPEPGSTYGSSETVAVDVDHAVPFRHELAGGSPMMRLTKVEPPSPSPHRSAVSGPLKTTYSSSLWVIEPVRKRLRDNAVAESPLAEGSGSCAVEPRLHRSRRDAVPLGDLRCRNVRTQAKAAATVTNQSTIVRQGCEIWLLGSVENLHWAVLTLCAWLPPTRAVAEIAPQQALQGNPFPFVSDASNHCDSVLRRRALLGYFERCSNEQVNVAFCPAELSILI